MLDTNRMKKVVCPITRDKGGETKTYWQRMGTAFVNRDGSWNIHLDALPVNNKLQVRDFDERDLQQRQDEGPMVASGGAGH